MSHRGELLREVMLETGTTQSELSRISGVHQPSISQFLSGRVELSDDMLDRLLSCLGYRLEVVRRPVRSELPRSEERSWRLHRQLSRNLNPRRSKGGGPRSCGTWSGSVSGPRDSRTCAISTGGSTWSSAVTCRACIVS
jgi:transcriptional regulator with XRE-family HTH domain